MDRFFTIFTVSVLAAGATAVSYGAGQQPSYGVGQGANPQDWSAIHEAGNAAQQQKQEQALRGPDAATPFNQGMAFMKAKNYPGAVSKFEAALKANPNLPQAHLLAAFCLRKLGPSNYPASLNHVNAALKLNPNLGEAYESRGVLSVKMGKKDDAEKI